MRLVLVGAATAIVAAFLSAPLPLIDKLRALDYGVCAQLPTHMLMPGGVALPLCARNTGIYSGTLLGTLWLVGAGRWRRGRLPERSALAVLLALFAAMVVDGTNSLLLDLGMPHLYQPSNALRLLTGIGAGMALAAIVLPVAAGGFWMRAEPRASLTTSELPAYLGAGGALFLVIVSQWAPLLYPVALFSTIGLLVLLSTMNAVLLTIALRAERRYGGPAALLAPYGAGFVTCFAELALLATVKTLALG